jgi:hypothetical protein
MRCNRGLWALRMPLEHLGADVYPDMFSRAGAHEMFGADGRISDAKLQKWLAGTVECFLKLVEAAKNYPAGKSQWIEFLGEHPDAATERVETVRSRVEGSLNDGTVEILEIHTVPFVICLLALLRRIVVSAAPRLLSRVLAGPPSPLLTAGLAATAGRPTTASTTTAALSSSRLRHRYLPLIKGAGPESAYPHPASDVSTERQCAIRAILHLRNWRPRRNGCEDPQPRMQSAKADFVMCQLRF